MTQVASGAEATCVNFISQFNLKYGLGFIAIE